MNNLGLAIAREKATYSSSSGDASSYMTRTTERSRDFKPLTLSKRTSLEPDGFFDSRYWPDSIASFLKDPPERVGIFSVGIFC